jgi:uncharacterized protein
MNSVGDSAMTPATSATPLFLGSLGFVAGVCSGLLGIGGGLVIVPALTLLVGYPIKRAVGASLGTIVLVSSIGGLAEFMIGANIQWSLAIVVTAGSLVGARLASRILPKISERTLRILFAASLLIAAYRMLTCLQATSSLGLFTLADHAYFGYALALPVGLLGGLTSTLFGLGGGIVTVPGLTLLFGDVSFHAARATSLLTMVPTSGFGAHQHSRLGNLDLGLVKQMLPLAILGSVLGVIAVNHIPAAPCRIVFALLLIVVTVRLLVPARERAPQPRPTLPPSATWSALGCPNGRRWKSPATRRARSSTAMTSSTSRTPATRSR